jgi:hypothetical protein
MIARVIGAFARAIISPAPRPRRGRLTTRRSSCASAVRVPRLPQTGTARVHLIRAVNVGGTAKLPDGELRALAADLGAIDVSTYIQSARRRRTTLLTLDYVRTLFHEFGHGLFSDVRYPAADHPVRAAAGIDLQSRDVPGLRGRWTRPSRNRSATPRGVGLSRGRHGLHPGSSPVEPTTGSRSRGCPAHPPGPTHPATRTAPPPSPTRRVAGGCDSPRLPGNTGRMSGMVGDRRREIAMQPPTHMVRSSVRYAIARG